MKTLTVKQPWASLIVEGIKDIENRTWKTNFRGRMLIHASAKPDYDIRNTNNISIYNVLRENEYLFDDDIDAFCAVGAIIGSVEIVDCVINYPSIWAEKQHCTYYTPCKDLMKSTNCLDGCRHFSKPIYNWVLANPVKFEKPIPCKGALSLWDYKGELPL